jgi:hypothetical protein
MQGIKLEQARLELDQMKKPAASTNTMSFQNYFDYGKTLMPNRSVADVKSWIAGLPLTPQEKANLANSLGLAK